MLHLLTFILLTLPGVLVAAGGGSTDTGFVPLVGIPYVDTTENIGLEGYVDALYKAAISIAAFLAVLKIIYAGVLYMLSEVVTNKEKAKKEIYGAIIGLLIVIGAFLLLNTINPQLTTLNALQDIKDVQVSPDQLERPADAFTPKAGDIISNCAKYDSLTACEQACDKKEAGEIVEYQSKMVCKSHPSQEDDIKITDDVTINENLIYTQEELSELQRTLNKQNALEFPIRNILRGDIENEKATCSGEPYIIKKERGAGFAPELFLICTK